MSEPQAKPAVLIWYRVYAAGMSALYLVLLIAVGALLVIRPEDFQDPDVPVWLFTAYLIFIIGLSLVLAGVFIASFFLKPKPWTWVYHLVLICLGLTSPCCLPACVPILIFWIREDCRHYFGRR